MLVNLNLAYTVVYSEEFNRHLVVAEDRLSALQEVLGPLEEIGVKILGTPELSLVSLYVIQVCSGHELVGVAYKPMFGSTAAHGYQVLSAGYVSSDSGTGLVHSAPGHGHEDYLTWKEGGARFKIVSPVDDHGNYTPDITTFVPGHEGEQLVGKSVLGDANGSIIDILEKRRSLLKEEVIRHKYPYDWKTDKPVIVRLAFSENRRAWSDDALERPCSGSRIFLF